MFRVARLWMKIARAEQIIAALRFIIHNNRDEEMTKNDILLKLRNL